MLEAWPLMEVKGATFMSHFYPHMSDIIFDQSARSIFARCQALAAACVTNKNWVYQLRR